MNKKRKTADEKAKQRLVMAGLIAGIFVIMVLVAVLMAIIESYKTVSLDVMVTPLDAKVELTEMLGDNTNVYVNIGADNAILKVNPYDAPKMDDDIVFSIPVANTYLFDAETEMVIR